MLGPLFVHEAGDLPSGRGSPLGVTLQARGGLCFVSLFEYLSERTMSRVFRRSTDKGKTYIP